jgi:hypothetical protein
MIAPVTQHGHAVDQFHASSSLRLFETLERAMPSLAAMSSAVSGRSEEQQRLDLRDRAVDAHCVPMSPQRSTNCSTDGEGNQLSVISVMTEISSFMMESSLWHAHCRRAQVAGEKLALK